MDFEKILAYSFLRDEKTLISMISSFQDKHFDNKNIAKIFSFVRNFYIKYSKLPEIEVVKVNLDDNEKETLEEINSISFDIVKNSEWLDDETDKYIKQKALENAIIESAVLVEKGKCEEIEKKITDALTVGTKVDLGLAYFKDIKERAVRLFKFKDRRVKTNFLEIDKVTNGGLIIPSLSVILGRVNLGKSLFLSNLALNLSEEGKNVVLFSLEIAQDLIAQRIDGHITGYNLNEIYQDREKIKDLIKKAHKFRKQGYGEIYIKEYPPKSVSVADFRNYLRELDIRKIKYDVILVDYLTLVKAFGLTTDSLYMGGKISSENLRALSYYTKCPVITVAQLNREGIFANFKDLDMYHTGESMGIIQTADFCLIIGKDEEEMVFESEISFKCIKNRLGPAGSIWKMWLNPFSLRLFNTIEEFVASFDESGGNPQIKER